jgi:hypothetical protein
MNRVSYRLSLLGAALLATAALTGCSEAASSGSSAPAGGPAAASSGSTGATTGGTSAQGKACALLTKQEASTILNMPVDDGKDGSRLGVATPTCTYVATGGTFATVGLTIFDSTAAKGLIDLYKSQYKDLSPLSGLGDAALAGSDGRLVVAVKGGTGCVMLRTGDAPSAPDTSTQAMKAICEKVFG